MNPPNAMDPNPYRRAAIDQHVIDAAMRIVQRERAKGAQPYSTAPASYAAAPVVDASVDAARTARVDSRETNTGTSSADAYISASTTDEMSTGQIDSERVMQEQPAAAEEANDRAEADFSTQEIASVDSGEETKEPTSDEQRAYSAEEMKETTSEEEDSTVQEDTGIIEVAATTIDEAAADQPEEAALTGEIPVTFIQQAAHNAHEINALYLDTFFGELQRCGVIDYVISPGSRSTPLAMKAYERFSNVYVHVDERGAAFFALGLAKAKRRPVAVICTSGTAVGNWMPAVLEAESSRVPLLLLSADRPARLQHVGAPQTCDQIKMFGDHVKQFIQMPEPTDKVEVLTYVRQMALDACIAAHGAVPDAQSCDGGPVHLNFPFDEPLLPSARLMDDLVNPLPPTVVTGQGLLSSDARGLLGAIKNKRTIALCGEGTVSTPEEAEVLIEFAHKRKIPLIADPLSGLRAYDDAYIIDSAAGMVEKEMPSIDAVIRFGRWPIAKGLCSFVRKSNPLQIVVDMRETRDIASATSLFVRSLPVVMAAALRDAPVESTADEAACREWIHVNERTADKLNYSISQKRDNFEGAYIAQTLDLAPEESLVYCANSMSIRALDRYYRRSAKDLRVLCNRGLNGIDGTLSSAIGAAQAYEQTTLITGDLALLHDTTGFAFQNEMRVREMQGEGPAPSIIVVLLNNNGGAIFDILPQKSQDAYFERLFLTPQNVNYKAIAQAFGIPYQRARSLAAFRRTYAEFLGQPGINLIEIPLALAGVEARYFLP